jgi:peroxiredoxin
MNKLIGLIGIIFLATIFGCKEKEDSLPNNEFKLIGELEGIENGTWINLVLNDKTIDSTQIFDNSFSFKGSLDHPKDFNLYIKDSRNYAQIWLEPKTITFKAKNEEFSKAKITGSNTQNEQKILRSSQKDYRNRRDSLTTIYRDPKVSDSLKKVASDELQKIYDSHTLIEQDFIKNNPKSYVSAFLVDFYSTTFGRTKTTELYNTLSDSLKSSSYGKNINRYLELNKDLKIGDKYVNFAMTNENGEMINLSDFNGKLILLDFWASWCGPCIEEYPALKKAYSEFNENNFEIVGLSQDQSKDRWLKAIEKNELNWVNLWNEKGNNADPYLIYGINGIPDNFLINKKGIIVARNLRGEKLMSKIKEELDNKASR